MPRFNHIDGNWINAEYVELIHAAVAERPNQTPQTTVRFASGHTISVNLKAEAVAKLLDRSTT